MLSIYVHFPFCKKRCHYCDFITYSGKESLIHNYINALPSEISYYGYLFGRHDKVHSVYFGGGTPSIIPLKGLELIVKNIFNYFSIDSSIELTIEVNPGTLTPDFLSGLKEMGMNRLSIGAQSFNDNELKILGRIHKRDDIEKTFFDARRVGFKNINLDLMFGYPTQTMESFTKTLDAIQNFEPEHISLYSMTIEPGTQMEKFVKEKKYQTLDEDLIADMYEFAINDLAQNNYYQYEISNFSKDKVCVSKHNMQYWLNEPYLGLGVGAHSSINNKRFNNVDVIEEYLKLANAKSQKKRQGLFSTVEEVIDIDKYTSMQETMMLGLRLTDQGVSETQFAGKYGIRMTDVFKEEIEECEKLELVEWVEKLDGLHLRLTKKGVPVGNQVFKRFV